MAVTINPFVNASVVSKPQPHSDTGSRRWASGGTLRQAGSNGSPFEALPRLLQLPPSARMVVGSSPSSASCPASPLPSPSTPRTRSPATSSASCRPARFLRRSTPRSDWCHQRRFLPFYSGVGGLTLFSLLFGKSPRFRAVRLCS
ncbi:uncharacterized protein LOC120698441 isoform X1 [Panicum virgatum]|uniref:uncharacterized protein LOC120698441 isoform X1 n=1 Tax=Panicum virgatum TaxID=38727 RepID=UPI0019D692CB|nr:uncharacterized protein LOC120698441 isoform X1 [Panicum virgatum]